MSRSLPANPTIEALKKQAKQLLKAHKDGNVSCCEVLRPVHRFKGKTDDEILHSGIKLADAQFALAMDYGFGGWANLKGFLDTSARVRKGVTLDWKDVVGDKPHCRTDGRDLVVENLGGKEAALHTEFGGMSWDNYQLGVDVLFETGSSQNAEFGANVQICPRGTTVFCQMFGAGRSWGNCINLWHWISGVKEEHHVASVPCAVRLNTWHRFDVAVESPKVCIFFDGKEVIEEKLTVRSDGMPGLVVNYNSDARVRLRNLRVRFLTPTRRQVEEYGRDAITNWQNYKRQEIAAGRRKGMDDNFL